MRPLGVVAALLLFPASAFSTQFSCDETGVLAAIAAGGGPHTFACAGPTTVVTSAELVIPHAVTLDGEGLLTLSGDDAHRVVRVEGASPFAAELRNLALTQGVVAGNGAGGCISASADLTLSNVQVSGCQAAFGGGVVVSGAQLTLDGSTVSDNLATGGEVGGFGGGVAGFGASETVVTNSVIRDNTANLGGGIGAIADLAVTGSTIAGNVAGVGGGILALETNSVAIARSTISGNRATNASGEGGGGIATQTVLLTVIEDSTLAGNHNAAITQAGSASIPVPTLQISGSTIAANTGSLPTAIHQIGGVAQLRNTVISGRCDGSMQNLGGSFQTPGANCGATSSSALKLGKLGDHGGPTQTIPLLPGSVAIDAAVGCPPPATDQRGVARPQRAGCDSGAYEQDFGPQVPALPPLGVAALLVALVALGVRARRDR